MVDDAERINEIEQCCRHKPVKLLSIAVQQGALQAEQIETSPRECETCFRQLHTCVIGIRPRKIHGIGAEPTANLEDPLALPARKLCELRYMRLDEDISASRLLRSIRGYRLCAANGGCCRAACSNTRLQFQSRHHHP